MYTLSGVRHGYFYSDLIIDNISLAAGVEADNRKIVLNSF